MRWKFDNVGANYMVTLKFHGVQVQVHTVPNFKDLISGIEDVGMPLV